jgi:very-short-patch-repair endonuclease
LEKDYIKKVLLYGRNNKNIPWIEGFKIQADGNLEFDMSGANIFEIEKENQQITWLNLFHSKLHELCTNTELLEASQLEDNYPSGIYDKYRERLWDRLKQYCHLESQVEQDFFDLYCQLCFYHVGEEAFLPALIPHVYINWSFSKEKRSTNEEPYVVDFVFKSPAFGTNNLVIVEIDGPSHYASYNSNLRQYTVCEKKYADHLAKDRWLRKQGFKVFRIGNDEIRRITSLPEKERLEKFYFFFREVFGDIVFIEGYHSW